MATNRKLQAEIDRVLKRVSEGMEEFDQIWEKVHTASTPNLKEKYEADLKKEIKKLQRYRDQIKSWVSSSDVKNKSPLLEARKNIENEMERFKVLEKETKTKAYSKEGLSLVTKKKTDPRADPKYETIAWIKKAVRDLKGQIETMQKVSANKAKKGKPKTKGAPEPEESSINWIERHQWHIEQLSKNKRRLEKNEVTIQQVQEIKDDVSYYIESNQNPDFFEDEFLYNALDEAAAANGALDDDYEVDPDFGSEDEYSEEDEEEEVVYEATPKQVAQTEDAAHPVPALLVPPASSASSTATAAPTTTTTAKIGAKTPPPNSIIGSLSSVNSTNTSTVTTTTPTLAPVTPTPAKPAVPTAATVPPTVTPSTTAATIAAAAAAKAPPARVPAVRPVIPAPATSVPRPTTTPKVTPLPAPTQPGGTQTAATTATTTAQTAAQTAVPRAPLVKGGRTGSGPPSPTLTAATIHLPQTQSTQPPAPYSHPPPPNQQQVQQQQQLMQQQLQLQLQQLQQQQNSTPQVSHPQTTPATTQTQSSTQSAPSSQTPLLQPQSQLSSQSHPQQTAQQHSQSQPHQQTSQPPHAAQRQPEHPQHPPNHPQLQHSNSAQRHPQPPGGPGGPSQAQPLAQAHAQPSPIPPQRTIVDEDYHYNLKMLEPSLRHTPDPRDSERPKQYAPRNPYRTPPYFPSVPAPVFDDPAIFEKFSTDTLFFIFYFQQGTPHQYLAARELKKQSWRYHKNFLTWFQRHDEPKLSTEEYEQGAYVYFDYESGWSTSIKTDFTFEYRHLEDELWVPTNASM